MTTMGEDLYEEGRGEERVKVARNLLLLNVDKATIMRMLQLTNEELAEVERYVDEESMTNALACCLYF